MARRDKFTAWLQERLNDLGYEIEVDGINGPQTQAAIKDVQRAFGQKETGMADQAFMEVFQTIKESGPAELTGSVGSPSGAVPNVSGRMQLTPPMPRLRPRQGGAGMMPPDPLIGPTGRSGLDMPPSGGMTPEMLISGPVAPGMPPLGPPPGVPMTGPGGSPAPQYPPPPSNPFGELLEAGLGNMMIPGYAEGRQQPLPDYSTANSPLAGVNEYQTDMAPMPSGPPPMSMEDFAGRFDPTMIDPNTPPMQAGMIPPEIIEAVKRELMQKLLQGQ